MPFTKYESTIDLSGLKSYQSRIDSEFITTRTQLKEVALKTYITEKKFINEFEHMCPLFTVKLQKNSRDDTYMCLLNLDENSDYPTNQKNFHFFKDHCENIDMSLSSLLTIYAGLMNDSKTKDFFGRCLLIMKNVDLLDINNPGLLTILACFGEIHEIFLEISDEDNLKFPLQESIFTKEDFLLDIIVLHKHFLDIQKLHMRKKSIMEKIKSLEKLQKYKKMRTPTGFSDIE